MINNGFKNTLQILIILIFNSFLAQTTPKNKVENNDKQPDMAKKDTIVLQKEQLEDIVKLKADYIRNDIPKKMSFLNKKAQINYQDMQIDADYISIDWDKGMIFARGELDEKGRIKKPAIATQADKKYEYNEVNYNYKTRQAIAYNARTEESEGVIVAEKTKKVNDSVYFMRRGKYTTDEMFLKKKDTIADYYMLAPNIKLVKGKENAKVITGPIQMYIEQVPTPLALPFAILPFSDKRSAGILIPSFGERQDVGFFLNGLGYYQPIGEHFDFKALLDFYTKGSWNIRPELNYKKNYQYTGSFNADIGSTVVGIKGLSNYSKTATYRINWRHQQDAKANPFLQFSASVDVVSTKFYNNTINNNYIFNQNSLNAQQNSSISVTKRFLNLPITINGTASYSQNFSTGLSDLRLPQLTVNVNQFYLFKPKTGVRSGLLENVNVTTGLSLSNYVTTNQGELFTKVMWDKMQTGLKNNISLGTTTTFLRYFNITLGAGIDNVLTTKTLTKAYDPINNKIDNTYHKNIAGFSTFNTYASVQTTLYGMLKFGKNSKIQAIRHMVTPSIGFSYTPDFSKPSWGYYRNYYDANGNSIPYSIFEGGIYGSPSLGLSKSVSFSINNNIEMKVKSKKDSTGVRKIKIFENLGISFSYNAAAPNFKWSPISINAQNGFFNNKMNFTYSALIDPYKTIFLPGQTTGTRIDELGGFSLQNLNIGLNFSLNDILKGNDKKEVKYQKQGSVMYEPYYFDDDNYARFKQPWTLSVNTTYTYNRNLTLFGTSSASVGLNGSLKLTPYWNINGSTHYDFVNKSFAYTRLGFTRDLRSFTINFNWVPVGQYKVYDFFIGIKANILRDAVKYKSRSFPQTTSSF